MIRHSENALTSVAARFFLPLGRRAGVRDREESRTPEIVWRFGMSILSGTMCFFLMALLAFALSRLGGGLGDTCEGRLLEWLGLGLFAWDTMLFVIFCWRVTGSALKDVFSAD